MKTLLNRQRFLKVAEYTNEHYFSKPYTISPVIDRWFNQLAMVEFEGRREPYHLSLANNKNQDILIKDLLKFPVDVVLDDELNKDKENKTIPKDKILLLFRFYSRKFNHDEERKALELRNDKKALEAYERDKAEAKVLYERITTQIEKDDKALLTDPNYRPRVKSVINIPALEQQHGAKVKSIVHRPNHGVTHSARAAYFVTAIHTYLELRNGIQNSRRL